MKLISTIFFLFALGFHLNAQHTFSIVAIDSITGEIGSAGATCGDSIVWPGTPGAYIISDVLPGIGAIHSQSYYISQNQNNARTRMLAGDNPEEIISWLEDNDVENNPARRQYGIVDFNNGSPRSAGFTGAQCFDEKDHMLGANYAIQGNILSGVDILDSMEARFLREEGCLADKIMAAMQGANVVGADSRCFVEGVSSLSAFIRMARADDEVNDLFLDINVAGTADGVEPINELQDKYDLWKTNFDCTISDVHDLNTSEIASLSIYPNPVSQLVQIDVSSRVSQKSTVGIFTMDGMSVKQRSVNLIGGEQQLVVFDVSDVAAGIYLVKMETDSGTLSRKLLVK